MPELTDSGTTAMIILNRKMEEVIKTVKPFEDSDILIKVKLKQMKLGKRTKRLVYC